MKIKKIKSKRIKYRKIKPRKFFLRDVRCFKDEKEFNISPLTFLVGENSTGKSTILGCIQALTNSVEKNRLSGMMYPIDFNLEPFQMGAFENIVRKASPKITKFELGFEFCSTKGTPQDFRLRAIIIKQPNTAEPIIKEMCFIFSDGEIKFISKSTTKDNKPFSVTVKEKGSKKIFTIALVGGYPPFIFFFESLSDQEGLFRKADVRRGPEEKQLREFLQDKDFFNNFYLNLPHSLRFFSFAPIRSKPQRTYNPWGDTETSSGSEIPVKLRNLSMTKNKDWKQLQERLQAFGKNSGLFTDIKVKNLGRLSSSPFQIELKIRRAQATNLADAGYGVSQILPLLARVLKVRDYTFLMQQPEVHLHPKAQAELVSLLIELSKQKENNFIIETHSDYLIDRARIEIMQGKIKPEDVSLIYLEPKGSDVKVHNLRFNKKAEIEPTPPESYHKFFFSETHKLLGWND